LVFGRTKGSSGRQDYPDFGKLGVAWKGYEKRVSKVKAQVIAESRQWGKKGVSEQERAQKRAVTNWQPARSGKERCSGEEEGSSRGTFVAPAKQKRKEGEGMGRKGERSIPKNLGGGKRTGGFHLFCRRGVVAKGGFNYATWGERSL